MSQRAEMPQLTWSDLGVGELLPTGTVTLLLADVEGSTRLWETEPEKMATALALMNRMVDRAVAAHDGVRPLEQGEGDSFVTAFARASDAVACALELQRAPLAPIRLRIGIHTGEIQLRDEANYAGPTINRTARLRDLAHGGQTVLSGATEPLIVDRLPDGVWLTDLGSYSLRDLPRPERAIQLCHPDLRNEFPPLRVRQSSASHNLPVQLTSFVGRQAQMTELRELVRRDRLVTLTGAGGSGKTRLAVEVASDLSTEFGDGLWYVDLAPITNPVVVPVTTARALGLPDQQGRSTLETLVLFFGEKTMLLLLDNCEHVLDACGGMVVELLAACPHLTILTTSREPLGVPGELSWRVPSLSLDDEAIELFTDRGRRARPEFVVGEDNTALVAEICERLDGMPLAIELAAARIRALSLSQILDSLHDRFRLLTGGARTAVRRQQTLRASVDWSHALLTEPEQVLFRRLAVFAGGFDLDAAQAVTASSEVESYQLLDQLSLLVDKSLVVADDSADGMRYRLLETVRQYAQEKLGESGEGNEVRTRHRDYYTATIAELDSRGQAGVEPLLRWATAEIDNLRAAYVWSRENSDPETALRLVSSLQQYWIRRSVFREALAGFDAILDHQDPETIAPEVWVRAVADHGATAGWVAVPASLERAQGALAIARRLDDPALISRALLACGMLAIYNGELARQYFSEAFDKARTSGDLSFLCELLLTVLAAASFIAGEPLAALAAAEEGCRLADELGDRFIFRGCETWRGATMWLLGDLTQSAEILRGMAVEADSVGDPIATTFGYAAYGFTLAHLGQAAAAHAAAQSALRAAEAAGGYYLDTAYIALALAALADRDHTMARKAAENSWRNTVPEREPLGRCFNPMAEVALACGDLAAAQDWADRSVALAPGCHQARALTTRALIALAQGEPERAERDVHGALTVAARAKAYMRVPDTLECLARLAAGGRNHPLAARLLGAAEGMRQRTGAVRFPMYQADHDITVAAIRESLGQSDFDAVWAEGAAMSNEDAIAYAQRGRGERKRATSGWGSLTPGELDVVRLVREGLGNKEIGARLFISPRTVQTHLTHVYAKLDITSRVQLARLSLEGGHTA